MAKAARSSDILAICLILSGYNLNAVMSEVIEHIEAYQKENDCFFGTGPEDFRNALFWLAYNIGFIGFNDYDKFSEIMKKVSLLELIRPILITRELYCNDEGEYWEGEYAPLDSFNDCKDNWFHGLVNPVNIKYEYEIRKFFEVPGNLTNQSIIDFLREHNDEERILSMNFNRSL